MEQSANQPEPNNFGSAPEASPAANRDGLRSIVAGAVVMPALTAAAAQMALAYGDTHRWLPSFSGAVYFAFVFLIAVLSYAIGARLRSRLLQGLVLGWAVLLIDILLVTSAYQSGVSNYYEYYHVFYPGMLLYTFFSAQAGFLAACAALGGIAWYWRVAVFVLGLVFVALGCCLIPEYPFDVPVYEYNAELEGAFWPTVVVCQGINRSGEREPPRTSRGHPRGKSSG